MSYLDLYDSSFDPLPERLSSAAQSQDSSHSGSRGKRLSLQMSSDLHRHLKLIALEDEETMNSLVIGVLRRFVAEREQRVSRLRRERLA
jgi:hypothetical protein